MPVPDTAAFVAMLDAAKEGGYAYPAVNVCNTDTANAAMAAFASARSDGIIQLSVGAGKHASGPAADAALGAAAVAEHVHRVAARLPVYVALHTDHCQAGDLGFVRSLLAETGRRVDGGGTPLFNGHMFDGSALPLEENLEIARGLLEECGRVGVVPEFEAGVVGGEEDGAATTTDTSKLYTTPGDMLRVAEVLGPVGAPFLFAATFGNVHGIYKPGNVKLRPDILRDGQAAVEKRFGPVSRLRLVFHGGSGTPRDTIRETLGYGVVKMNVDTATQYAFTRAVAGHVLSNYDKVLMVDGELGDKKAYDPRSYLKKATAGMAARVVEAAEDLLSAGRTICPAAGGR